MDYIRTMRKMIGHETLFTVGCGILIENEGRICCSTVQTKIIGAYPAG